MIYADEMAYDEPLSDQELATSITLEETKSPHFINKSQEGEDLKSSYWMPVLHENLSHNQLEEMLKKSEIKRLDLP